MFLHLNTDIPRLLILLLITPTLAWSQSKFENRGDRQFQLLAFEGAISNYKLCLKDNPENSNCILKIAHCYQELRDFTEAEQWYNKAFSVTDNVEAKYKYNFAYCLYINGKHSEAEKWFLSYNNSLPNPDNRVQNFLESIKSYDKYFIDTSFVLLNNLNINSEASDFPAVFFENELIFISNKRYEDNEIGESPFNIYMSKKNLNTGKFSSRTEFKNKINAQYHSGPLTLYNNYSKIIVCQTSDQIDKKENINHFPLQLYEGEYDKEQRKTTNLNRIPLLDASNLHPTVNEAGTILIFSSDINLETRGMDLFMSVKKENVWGEPQSLGNIINSNGDELFPYLFNDSILHFASNGHGGLGGIDIFRVNLNQQNLGLENLSYPINSPYDDFSIVVDSNGIDGYFASNRLGGKGNDDIYSFETIKVRFKGTVKNKENDLPINNVKVLVNTIGGEEKTTFTDSLGIFEVIVHPKEDVYFELFTENYLDNKVSKIKPITKNLMFYLEPQKVIEKDVVEEQKPLIAQKKSVIEVEDVKVDSLYIFLEIIDPDNNKVLNSSFVPNLSVDKNEWGKFFIEFSVSKGQ
jgi:tetratricopeptide (TPR) repeat protein